MSKSSRSTKGPQHIRAGDPSHFGTGDPLGNGMPPYDPVRGHIAHQSPVERQMTPFGVMGR